MDPAGRRRQVTVAGHTGDLPTAAGGLDDENPAVRGAALGALQRLGALDAHTLTSALSDPDPGVRRRAAELSAAVPDIDLVPSLSDPIDSVVETAAWACGEQGATRAVERLCELAAAHSDPLCREAAVAALGAIGDPAGRQAVLAACTDRATVRRRAVIALAAFDGAEVEAAIEAALDDRDWQVRQAAEELSENRSP